MSGRVLVLNTGSSSVKYSLLDPGSGHVDASGLAERIGVGGGRLTHRGPDGEAVTDLDLPDHEAALSAVLEAFATHGPRLAEAGLVAVGHRVVHGGDRFSAPARVDAELVDVVRSLVPLAPLHNPANVEGLEVALRMLPDVPQVAVFDTAFHQTLPPAAYTYAVPREWQRDHGVRRYGFHGTSHAYVSREAARLLDRPPEDVDLIVLHLGNGASACAVRGGRSVETSMGLTPLEGLVMGTRSGDVDPALAAHLQRVAGLGIDEVDAALNRRSGLLALAGASDLREVHRLAASGDVEPARAAELALDVYCHRIRKYVGAYYAVLGRLDAVVLTGGVGENDQVVRERSLRGLEGLGIELDQDANARPDKGARRISTASSPVAVLVVPTNEELEIARQTLSLLTP
ncbi:acetate kinase [Kineosporiaceae bacterium SCSIO 59966]|nr:acetate kinase [Kineosporiaceae bacterium SCSIO 59966]